MDVAQILRELAVELPLPVEAIRAAEADRAAMVPIFLEAIEQRVSNGGRGPYPDPLFFGFHMLGAWREKSAYRPLARLLRLPSDALHEVISEAVTDTSHRVMAAVFDGDPTPLYEIVLDEEADEFVRSRMCEAVAMVTLRGELSREEAARFLRACYMEIRPQAEYFVWDGWQSAVAMLGLVELKPLVEQAFARGFISTSWLDFEDFEGDIRAAIEGRALPADGPDDQYAVFGDTIEELSTWACFLPEKPRPAERAVSSINRIGYETGPARNPLRKVGRNDPCPCGSGKKYKKCCLKADAEMAAPIDG